MEMYLTVGELGEGFAACLRRGHPSQLGLTGKPTTVHPGKERVSGHSPGKLQALHILLLRGKYCRGGGSC